MIANNFIIHQRASQYQWSGECFLSIKSFYRGSARYRVRQREYLVSDDNYLLLNDCTKYHLVIDSVSPIESFCVFFTPEFVGQIVSEINSTEEQLLDFSTRRADGIKLVERNYVHGGQVSQLLQKGRGLSIGPISEIEREEFYHTLLDAILFQNDKCLKAADNLVLKKTATREEIYRRLCYAKDYIDCNYTENLTLKKIAQVAMLSENHLLRNFGQVFNTTPFQYITRLKIAEARRQVIETDKNITEIALSLGYSSLSNFSYYFRSIVGLSPRSLRKKVRYRK